MSRLKWMQCRKTKNWIDIIKKNKKYDIKAKTTHEHSHILKKTTMAKELRWTFNMYAMRVKACYLHVYAQTRSPYEKNWFFAWLCLLWSVFFLLFICNVCSMCICICIVSLLFSYSTFVSSKCLPFSCIQLYYVPFIAVGFYSLFSHCLQRKKNVFFSSSSPLFVCYLFTASCLALPAVEM